LLFPVYVQCLYEPPWSTLRHWDRWEFTFGLAVLALLPHFA
jgi:hypothetical protein